MRRGGRRWRVVAIATGVLLTLTGLWVGGFNPSDWFRKGPNPAVNTTKPLTQPTRVSGNAPPNPTGNNTSASKVPLPLILVATEPGRSPTEGVAYLGVVRESPQTYVGGAVLVNGARIKEIYPDYIVLEKEGRTARLYVDHSNSGTPPSSQSSSVASLLQVGGQSPPPLAEANSRSALTDYVRPSPVYDGSVMVGMEVYPGDRAAVFTQLGLKPGDLITSVEGVPLTDPSTAWNMVNSLVDGVVVSASIKRGSRIERLTLDGTLIAAAEQQRYTKTGSAGDALMP